MTSERIERPSRTALAFLLARPVTFKGEDCSILKLADRFWEDETAAAADALERRFVKIAYRKAAGKPDYSAPFLAVAHTTADICYFFKGLNFFIENINIARRWRRLLETIPGVPRDTQARFCEEKMQALFIPWRAIDCELTRAEARQLYGQMLP